MERKQKSGIGGKRIITLTGWTHHLHTNAKRKWVSNQASIPEILKGNKTVGGVWAGVLTN
jgi:hypothetical protein